MCNGQREKIPLWSNFDQHNHIIGCKFKKNLFNLWFYIDCIKILWITCVKPPEQGQIIRWGQFQATNEAFTTLVICCKFQKNCSELWLYMDFLWFHTCAGGLQRGKFWASQEAVITLIIYCKLQKILHRLFHDFIHVYSRRARADNLGWQNF